MVLEKRSLFIISNVKNTIPLSNSKYFANIRPTETYHIPNYWKFYEDFDKLFRLKIAALWKGENPILLGPIFMHSPHYTMVSKKVDSIWLHYLP